MAPCACLWAALAASLLLPPGPTMMMMNMQDHVRAQATRELKFVPRSAFHLKAGIRLLSSSEEEFQDRCSDLHACARRRVMANRTGTVLEDMLRQSWKAHTCGVPKNTNLCRPAALAEQ